MEELKFVQMVHLTNMAAMPIYGKSLKDFLLWNQKASDLESWYAASGTEVLPSLFKWWPGLTLTYFTARSNLVPYAFELEKGKTMDLAEIILTYDIKVGRCSRWTIMNIKGQGHSFIQGHSD